MCWHEAAGRDAREIGFELAVAKWLTLREGDGERERERERERDDD